MQLSNDDKLANCIIKINVNKTTYDVLETNIANLSFRGKYSFCTLTIASFVDSPNIDLRLLRNESRETVSCLDSISSYTLLLIVSSITAGIFNNNEIDG